MARSVGYSWLMNEDDRPLDPRLTMALRRQEERRAVDEAGGGVSEGFELTEQELIDHASHGDMHSTAPIFRDEMIEAEPNDAVYGEADEERRVD